MSRLLIGLLGLTLLVGCPGKDKKGEDSEPGSSPSTGTTTAEVQPPNAQDDTAVVEEGGVVSITVAANDLVGSNPLALGSLTVVEPPANGSLVVQANGIIDYTHDGGETTSDSMTYLIEDNVGTSSDIATVSITVTPINDLPVAVDDADFVDQGDLVVIDLLFNDIDVDDGLDPGSISLVDSPAYGTLVDNGDGTVDYIHDGTGIPYDSFSYTVSDFAGAVSNVAQVDLVVNTTNTPPYAGDDLFIVAEGSATNFALIYNDIDVDDGLDLASISVTSPAANGSVTVNLDGSVDYTHDGSETLSDSFTYRIDDNSGAPSNTAVVQVVVTPVNDPPTAADDVLVVLEAGAGIAAVLDNDLDPDNALNPLTVALVDLPQHGVAIVNGNGTIGYTHDGSQVVADSFTYTVNDMAGAVSNAGSVDVQITLVNDPPSALDDTGAVDEGGFVVVDLAANDTDSDDPLDLASINIATPPANGSITVNGDGTVQYDHDGSETLADSFEYTIDDLGGGTSNVATVDLTVAPVNDPPVANNDNFVVAEGGLNNLQNLLSNDVDPDDGLNPASIAIVTQPLNGIAIVNLNGTTTYSHDGSNTVADSYTYTVLDNSGVASNVATVNITVSGVNDPPVANNDTLLLAEGAAANVDVLVNDTDVDTGIDTTTTQIVTAPAHGTAVVQPNGSVDYTHNGSETVGDSFTYVVRDLGGITSNEATVTVVVNPVNDPPTANNDSIGVGEGGGVNIVVLTNDVDPDSAIDPASVTIVTGPVNGIAVVQANGSVDYTHDGSNTVVDSLTYTVDDTSGATSNPATVSISISAVNDAPVAVNDSGGAVDEGGARNVAVLANDTDSDDGLNPASVVVTTAPAHGTTQVLGDGSITYTHNGSETLSDSFQYTVQDFFGAPSNAATVSFTINPINDPPVANNDPGVSANEGALTNVAVLANDTDPDDGLAPGTVTVVTAPTHGTATPQANGTVNYQHDGTEPAPDSFTYTVQDASGATSNAATVSLNIQQVNDAPVAANDNGNVNEGAQVDLSVLVNDNDVDDGLDPASIQVISAPANGTAVPQAGGTIRYTHNGSETVSDSFTYRVRDFSGTNSNTATVNITVNPVNDPPVAANDSGNANEGALVNLAVLANDTDPDDGLNSGSVVVISAPANGSTAVQANGTINYTHNGSETLSDSFTYRVQDNSGTNSNTATVNLTINPVNDPPVAVNDSANVSEGGQQDISVLGNDSDPDDGLNPATVTVISAPANGTAVPQAGGAIRYTHNGTQTLSDSFTYRVSDFSGSNSNTATVNITITPVNDPPVAANDSANVNEGSAVSISVLSNDSDPDDGINSATVVVISSPTRGTAVVQAGGTIQYTHNGSETVSDSFTYRVSDFAGAQSNTATVNVTINPVNDAPVAVNDSANVNEGAFVDISVLTNDTDADDGINPGSVAVVANPTRGTAAVQAGGVIRYTHNGSETVSDSFTYRVSDFAGTQSNTATVNITINPVNDPPSLSGLASSVPEGSTGNFFDVLVVATDPDDGVNPNSLTITTSPVNGTAWVNAGYLYYDHNGSETLSDSISYRVYDYAGAPSNIASLSLTISPVNDPPVAVDDYGFQCEDGGYANLPVIGNDYDVDSALDPYSMYIWAYPSFGFAFPGPGGTIEYYGYGGWTGFYDYLSYVVSDTSGAQSNIGTVEVEITAPAGGGVGYLYAVRTSDDMLVRIDPNTLQLTDVGLLGVGFDFGELAYDTSRGIMYMVDGWSQRSLYTVNLNTGQATLIGSTGAQDIFSLAYHPPTDRLVAGSFSQGLFYEMDRYSGWAWQVGGPAGYSFEGMTYDSARDQLLALDPSGNMMWLDPWGGWIISILANTGGSNDPGLAYDSANDRLWAIDWSGNLFQYNPNNGYQRTTMLSGLGAHDGLAYVPGGAGGGGNLVGSYYVSDGPGWSYGPETYTCQEACALLFGGFASSYSCSTTSAFVDHQAFASTYGVGGCGPFPEDYEVGPFYTTQGDVSAYITDNCIAPSGLNYCFQ